MGLFRVFLLQSYKWDGLDWVWDLCVGLLYEHRFAMLKRKKGGLEDNAKSIVSQKFNLKHCY